VITRPGNPAVLELRDVDEPVPGPGQVRVRVRSTALNRADILQRRGLYPAPPGVPPDIPGLEYAGEVEVVGPGVAGARTGDRVMGILAGGGHAEMVVAHEGTCLAVPPGMDWDEAAAVPEAFLTAFDALFDRGGLAPGHTVLVSAAASGVGTAAVQLALAAGARVIGTSRSESKRRRLAQLGLTRVADPDGAALARAVRETAPAGLDVIVDLVGGPALPNRLGLLRDGGRLVLVGLLAGPRAELDLGAVLRRRATIVGTVLRSRTIEEKIRLTRAFAERAGPWLIEGRIRPVVDSVFPFERVVEAHEHLERNASFGKVVLRVAR